MKSTKLREWAYQRESLLSKPDPVQGGARDIVLRNFYSPKIKVSHWEYDMAALPFDNPVTFDQRLSVYNRLGTSNEPITMSVMKEDQLNVINNIELPRKRISRPMINIITYPTTVGQKRKQASLLTDIDYQHPNVSKIDYSTTMYSDYKAPYPFKSKIIPSRECEKPETKHRRINSHPIWEVLRDGYMFMDDDLPNYLGTKHNRSNGPPYRYDFPPEESWIRAKDDGIGKRY